MTRKIQIQSLRECPDKQWLGEWPKREDIGEIFREDVDVYLPDGTLAIAFRVGVLKTMLPAEQGGSLTPKNHEYWRWASKALYSDQRGFAAGKEIVTNPEIRLSEGQKEFFIQATRAKKPLTDLSEALSLLEDTRPSRVTYYIGKTEADGLVDVEELARLDSIVRKRSLALGEREVATAHRITAKLAWFRVWFDREWLPADPADRPAIAKAGRKRYVTNQPRANRCYSNVLGAIDRAGRIPYGRLTVSTTKRWDEFEANKPFYHEVNDQLRECLPEYFQVLTDRFQHVKDPKYNLFGTAFTTVTVNNNFPVAYHRDGQNAKGAVAALTVLERGNYDGFEFVFPELGIGFDIRQGDLFLGDNQDLIHGILPMANASEDAESITCVFYQRDRIIELDSLKCEDCRRQFLEHSVTAYPERGTGEPKWAGSWAGMWKSEEWREFKASKDLAECSETNHHGT